MSDVAEKSPRSYAPKLRKGAPAEASAYADFSQAALRNEEGQIPLKYRELISVAVALTTQCEMCLESHVGFAAEAGATQEEIAEVTFITAALRAGGAYTHGMKAMKMFHER